MQTEEGARVPRHVAIIMDGNGRWAVQRGLPRVKGHHQGVEAVRRVARAARDLGIEYLTLYSFSTENWSRPKSEIGELFSLLKAFIRRDLAELHRDNVRVRIIGERDGLPSDILPLLIEAEKLTCENTGQTLVIAFNYGSRTEIVSAARRLAQKVADGSLQASQIDQELFSGSLDTDGIPDPDLIIRTSGEKRLSNFLLWQAAYAEFVFTDCLWPDFGANELKAAIDEYALRVRRFGGTESRPGTRGTGS
ncbi:MAG: isoprenyl transferase [Rhizobiaceae bacterium]